MISVKRQILLVAALLTALASPLVAQLQPDGPWPKRLRAELVFVANQSDNDVSAYQIKSNGGLQPVAGSFPAGGTATPAPR